MTDQPGAGDRPMSYSEKYQGTEWGRPEPPAPPPSTRSGRPFLIAIVAVVIIAVAGLALIGFAMAPNGSRSSAGSTPAAAVGAVASPTLAPTPSPTLDPGKAVLARFWAIAGDPALSYHMTASGKSVLDKKTVASYKELVDVVGDEYSGWIDSSSTPKSQMARKDGVVWVKLPGKARVGRQTSARYFRLTPFMYLEMPAWLDYVKPVTVAGRPLHLLRSNTFYRPDIARMLDFQKFLVEPDRMVLDIYVSDDGVPVSAVFSADVDVQDHAFHGRTEFAFSKVGQKLKILVPKR